MATTFDVVRPTHEDRQSALETKRLLGARAASPAKSLDFRIQITDGMEAAYVPIPEVVYDVLVHVIEHFAKGNAVTVSPLESELTTGQAAEILNVSRPYVVQLLDRDAIPSHKVGTKRRVYLEDVLAYKRRSRAKREAAMQRLADQAAEYEAGR